MRQVERSQSGAAVGAISSQSVHFAGRGVPANFYRAECHAPVSVSDIEKLGYLVGRHGLALPPLLLSGHVSHKWVKRELQPRLSNVSQADRKEIESLLSGGGLKWSDEFVNRVVNTGLDEYLDKVYKASAYTAAHYLGLTDSAPTTAAGDTMSSHAGWSEVTAYSESNRPALTLGSVSSQSVNNTGNEADFTANGTATAGGAFITTDNTKGGSSGTLMTVGAFSGGDKSLTTSDTLSVGVTLTMADA